MESNAKIVQWSDGTYQLAVGGQLFDIRKEDEPYAKLFTKFEEFLLSKCEMDKRVILKPAAGSKAYSRLLISA